MSGQRAALKVLGLDPGTVTTGWGMIHYGRSRLQHVDNGLLVAPAKAPLHERLVVIFERLQAVLDQHQPDVVSVETVFTHRNTRSALALGHARGVILLAAAQRGIPIASYAPALIKKTVAGRGRADKFQMQMMVKTLLALPEVPAEDAADALAMSICHCHHHTEGTVLDRLAKRARC